MGKIGIFDSGFGGLTVLRAIMDMLPQYSYVYLGDNSRAPYGDRSFDVVHEYTLECTEWLSNHDCDLVILACNTASAKALRQIQQIDLPKRADSKRVLGVIRPTTEQLSSFSPEWNILCLPGFEADPNTDGTRQNNFAVISFTHKRILIGGTGYTGEIKVILFNTNKENFIKRPNEHIFIPLEAIHRIQNPGKKPVRIMEAQVGSILKETDIVRYQDVYGRVK
mgnify:CR=1 FL=1